MERLSTVEEAARLVADAAVDCPRALRVGALGTFRALVTRLAMETEDRGPSARAFELDDHLSALEEAHGSVSAALHGLSAALGVVERGLGRGRTGPRAFATEGLGRITRDEARAWARQVDVALSALESHVIRADCSAALRRDAWAVACLLAMVTAQAADNACVDIGPALECLADAGAILAQAIAVLASEAATEGREFRGDSERALLALVPPVDAGMKLMRAALQTRQSSRAVVTWRLISRGRTGLSTQQVEALVGRAVSALPHGNASETVSYAQALSRAAREYEGEWGAGALGAVA